AASRSAVIPSLVASRRHAIDHVQVRPDGVMAGDEVSGSDQQTLTIRRQRHPAGRPDEQGRAQLRLESLDLATERLLGNVQACRCAREVELLGRCYEI